jgi:hypothetical protein
MIEGWLETLLSSGDWEALRNPLLLDGKGQIVPGPIGPDARAFLDPSLYLSEGRKASPSTGPRPYPLSPGQLEQGAHFTWALYKLVQALTGHDSVAATTFKEVLIASTGGFVWYGGKFVGIYKKQPFIGRGKQFYRVGRPGRFILPHERKLVWTVTVEQILKELGWKVDAKLLRKYGPDHLIEKPDYDTTWRHRNYGIVFAYDLYPSEEDFMSFSTGEGVMTLTGDDPHMSDEELAKHKRVLRVMSLEDMLRIDAQGMLTLEAELPRLQECFADGLNG